MCECEQKIAATGLISGSDMTTEAAFMKLSHLLGREDLDTDRRRRVGSEGTRAGRTWTLTGGGRWVGREPGQGGLGH